jgi:hypothetical protein
VTNSLHLDERSKIYSIAAKTVVNVLEPRLEPLRARGELVLGHIWIGHEFQQGFSESEDHNLEVCTIALASSKQTHVERACKKSRSGQQKGDLSPFWPPFQ